jgi:DNA-binding NarL/FixJ family response regulator
MRRRTTSGLVSTSAVAGEGNVTAGLTGSNPSAERPMRARKKQRLPLVLIDPKPLTRQSISEMFAKALPEYSTVAASSCDELLQMEGGPPHAPALVIIHTRSAQLTDVWVQGTLDLVKLHLTDAPVVLLSDRDDVDEVVTALACGVRGYITTSVEAEVVFAALRLINAGGTFIPAHALRAAAAKPIAGSDCTRRELMNGVELTPRELSVVDLLREGKPNKLIAAELQMQESTVKVHVRNIMKKLRVANRTHAASVANRLFGQQASTALVLPPQTSNGGAGLLAAHAEAPGG